MKQGNFFMQFQRVVLLVVLALSLATTAVAQKKKKKGGGGVIRLEETIIEGRVQKPNAFFINTRQALVYEVSTLKESFVDEISKSVETGLF
ncbi:MAG: hypothetical protein GY847_33645 [Proteobacteria bacterium]|nr:hypothetical protein [Pseudomonadota bacterium]